MKVDCAAHREIQTLLALKKQLAEKDLNQAEKTRLEKEVSELQQKLDLD